MTDIDYAALRALAENATPGPGGYTFGRVQALRDMQAHLSGPTVIGLLDELEAARRAREDMAASLDARWEHSDHLSAKYWLRMRAAENAQKATEAENERLRAEAATEWEYAVRHVSVDGYPRYQSHSDRTSAEADFATCGWNCEMARRRPAGPWVPVPEQNPEPSVSGSTEGEPHE